MTSSVLGSGSGFGATGQRPVRTRPTPRRPAAGRFLERGADPGPKASRPPADLGGKKLRAAPFGRRRPVRDAVVGLTPASSPAFALDSLKGICYSFFCVQTQN
jgi:hypothetical protein